MAACADAPAVAGTFTASVTGATSAQLAGEAVAWTGEAGERRSFEIRLQPEGQPGAHIVFVTIARRRPAEGAYAVTEQAPDSASFDMVYTIGGGSREVVKGTGGEVVITESGRSRLAGRFDVVGERIDLADLAAGTRAVRLTGSFTAPCTDAEGRGSCE